MASCILALYRLSYPFTERQGPCGPILPRGEEAIECRSVKGAGIERRDLEVIIEVPTNYSP
jgi:hypothetical protein